jgi:hypothetical protein
MARTLTVAQRQEKRRHKQATQIHEEEVAKRKDEIE